MARGKASDFFSVQSDEEIDEVLSEEELEKGSGSKFTKFESEDEVEEKEEEEGEEGEEEEEEEEGRSAISNKRRREDAFKSDEEEDEEEEVVEEEEDEEEEVEEEEEGEGEVEDDQEDLNDNLDLDSSTNGKLKPLSKEQVEKNLKKIKKSGVVYISRIPPYMKPAKLRQILARFGEVNRIFLTPEDPKVYAKRVKYGGNKKKNYTEGWAEFVKKTNAKLAAETLNGNIIGGKKGSYYHDDLLNVKYLSKFKWHNLTEQIALEAQSRQEKMRAEIAQATRENKIFIENVEKHKMIQGIQKKQTEKGGIVKSKPNQVRRTFDQRQVESNRSDMSKKLDKKNVDKTVSRVLSKVF